MEILQSLPESPQIGHSYDIVLLTIHLLANANFSVYYDVRVILSNFLLGSFLVKVLYYTCAYNNQY